MVTQCTAEALPLSSPGADVIRFDTDRTQDPDGRRPADPAVTAAAERNRRRLGYLATKRAFDILISSLALGGACALLWDHIPHATSWGALVLGILAFAAAFCLVAWFLCANAYERGLAAKALSRIARRGPRSRHDKPKHMAR